MSTLQEYPASRVREPAPKHTDEEAELARVLASATFAKVSRLCALLAYVVEHSLASRPDELTEQQIGISVFGRTPGYNSAEDTIVRGTIRLLRQRLDVYYRDEGRLNQLQISIPKGGYIARFERAQTVPELADVPVAPPEPASAAGTAWPLSAKLALVASLCCILVLAALYAGRKSAATAPQSGPQVLWGGLFTTGRKTLIVPGDASLDAFVAWEQRPVTLEQYTQQTYAAETNVSRAPHGLDVPLAVRSVTPMADLRLVAELVRVPQRMKRPDLEPWTEIRYARDVAVGDSHDNNLILIGAETFNPWITLYRNSMDFYTQRDFNTDVFIVSNRAPQPGEAAHYEYNRELRSPAYTHIAFLDNSQGSGKVLIVEGTSMGTTYAAITFLTQEQLWRPVMEAATDHSGHLRNFEVLLASDFVRGGVTNTRRIALHVH